MYPLISAETRFGTIQMPYQASERILSGLVVEAASMVVMREQCI